MDPPVKKRTDTLRLGGAAPEHAAGAAPTARCSWHDRTLVVAFDGARLDAFAAPDLDDFLAGLDAALAECVVFDLGRVGVADSSGLAAIVRACTRLAPSVEVRIVAPSPQVARLLRTTEVDRLIPVYVSLESALCGREPSPHEVSWARGSFAR